MRAGFGAGIPPRVPVDPLARQETVVAARDIRVASGAQDATR